jgi:hypothetical protein
VRQWHVVHAYSDVGTHKRHRVVGNDKSGGWSTGKIAKGTLRQLSEVGVVHGPGPGDDHAWCSVVGIDVSRQIVLGQRLNVFFGPHNGTRQSATLVRRFVQTIKHNLAEEHGKDNETARHTTTK